MRQACPQIVENFARDVDAKGPDIRHPLNVFVSQNATRRPTHAIAGGEGHLDHSKLVIRFRLELKDDATLADGLGLEHYVVLTATLNVGNRIT